MKVARPAAGIVGVISAVAGIGSVLFAIISLLDGLWLTTLAFGVAAVVLLAFAYGLWIMWKGLAPTPAAARRQGSVE